MKSNCTKVRNRFSLHHRTLCNVQQLTGQTINLHHREKSTRSELVKKGKLSSRNDVKLQSNVEVPFKFCIIAVFC